MADAQRGVPGLPAPALFYATDPLENEVLLSIDIWEDHIFKEHPEVGKFFDLLKLALEDPDLMQRDRDNSSTCFYYRLTGRTFYKYADVYLTVVVDLPEGTKRGKVRTAHVIREVRPRPGEILWMKSRR